MEHASIYSIRRELLDQIAEEERLVRIHQAELAIQRQRQSASTAARTLVEDIEEQDWLETLDALQSSGPAKLEFSSQDEPVIHRLLPLVGGVTFTAVRALEPNGRTKSFEFQGNVRSQLYFTVTAEVELLETNAKVVALTVAFRMQSKELDQISSIASETCCIPFLFRRLASWAEFDARRTALLSKCQGKAGPEAVKWLSSDTLVIQITDTSNAPLCSLRLKWTWRCNRYERGKEELSLVSCNVSPHVMLEQSGLLRCVREIQNPEGLNDLIVSAGSCENAIRLLVQVLLGQ